MTVFLSFGSFCEKEKFVNVKKCEKSTHPLPPPSREGARICGGCAPTPPKRGSLHSRKEKSTLPKVEVCTPERKSPHSRKGKLIFPPKGGKPMCRECQQVAFIFGSSVLLPPYSFIFMPRAMPHSTRFFIIAHCILCGMRTSPSYIYPFALQPPEQ